MKKFCTKCNGTGRYLGLGMIKVDCDLCSDDVLVLAPALEKIDRQSGDYKKAVKEIMSISKVSHKEATKMFDEAYEKG